MIVEGVILNVNPFFQRWERENKALPLSQRRPTPERPKVSIDHPDWNAAAWEKSQVNDMIIICIKILYIGIFVNKFIYLKFQIQLIPCLRCGRTFFPDRLLVHKKSCKVGTMVRFPLIGNAFQNIVFKNQF